MRAGEKRILTDASLIVAPGELVAIIGESGAGKSTLLKTMAGVIEPAPAASRSAETRSGPG